MNCLLCAHRLLMTCSPLPRSQSACRGGTGCGKWLGPPKIGLAALRASVALPSREHRIIGSAFPLRLSAYRRSPEEFLERGEVGRATLDEDGHYSFAVP